MQISLGTAITRPWMTGGGGGATGELVWQAGSYDSETFELELQAIGEGTPTVSSSEMLLPDHEGVYRTIEADTAPWHGARQVANYAPRSDQPEAAGLPWGASLTTVVGTTEVDGVPCTELQFSDNANARFSITNPFGISVLVNQIQSWWLRAKSGTEVITLRLCGSATGEVEVTLTETWQRFTVSGMMTSSLHAGLWNRSAGVRDIYVAKVQLENADGRSDLTTPSEYVVNASSSWADPAYAYYANENGNTVSSNIVTEAVGDVLTEIPSLYAAPAYSNLALYSNDSTNAWWTKSNITPTQDQVGITGEPNTACKIAATSTSNCRIQSASVSVASGSSTIRGFFKEGDTEWVKVEARSFDASTGAWFNLNLGTVGTQDGTDDAQIRDVGNGWYECLIEFSTTTDLDGLIRVNPVDADNVLTIGSGEYLLHDSIELHSGMTIAEVKGSSPIITAGSTVTVDAVDPDYSTDNMSDTRGAIYAEVYIGDTATSIIDGFLGTNSTNLTLSDGTNTATQPFTVNTWHQVGVAYDAAEDNMAINVDGTWSSDATYDDTLLSGALDLFRTTTGIGLIRDIQRWDLDYDDAKDKVDELMGGGLTSLNSGGTSFDAPLGILDKDGNSFTVTESVLDSGGNNYTVI